MIRLLCSDCNDARCHCSLRCSP